MKKPILIDWLKGPNSVIKRKYYDVKELYNLFINDNAGVYDKDDIRFTSFIN